MSEREEKLRAFFANPTQELFDIGTKKASIENYLDYEDDADRNFMAVVLKKNRRSTRKRFDKIF
jgi:hypothetical protein